jgi:hypothetical protein
MKNLHNEMVNVMLALEIRALRVIRKMKRTRTVVCMRDCFRGLMSRSSHMRQITTHKGNDGQCRLGNGIKDFSIETGLHFRDKGLFLCNE